MLDLDPHRPAPPARPAATVLVLRDADAGAEIFCVQRSARSGFLGGAVVFPGGKLDPADADAAWSGFVSDVHPRARFLAPAGEDEARALAVAACRELLEEAGLVPLATSGASAATLRRALVQGRALLDLARELELRLDLAALHPFARWITPEAEARRFDARFYVLRAPADQEATHDDHETTHGFWAPPAEVLARWARGEVMLAPPTVRSLELLAEIRSVDDAFAVAGAQSLAPIQPWFVGDPVAPFLALPGDPAHPEPRRAVAGATRFVLRDGRFVGEDPPGDTREGSPQPLDKITGFD